MEHLTTGTQAFGFLETKGFVSAVKAADTMLKTAEIELISNKKVGSGFVSLVIRGEIGAVKAATEAGAASLKKLGEHVSTLIIQRPDSQLEKIL